MRLATGGSAVPASLTDLRSGKRSLAATITGWRNRSKPTFRRSSPAICKARRTTGYGFALPACSTALHAAVVSNQPGIVKFLIERGADINSKTKLGWTPLMMAQGIFFANARKDYPTAAALLRAAGAK